MKVILSLFNMRGVGLVVPPMSFDIILKCHFLFGAIAPSSSTRSHIHVYHHSFVACRCIAACCRHSILGALHHPSANMTQHQSANSTLYVAGIALTASWLATTVYLTRQNFSLRQCQQHALDDDEDDNRGSNKDKETDTLSSKTDSQFIMHEIGVIQSPFPQRAGCPRQGTLAPHVKSLLWLHPHLSPQVLDGCFEYSHVWIIFQFHLNPRNKARKSNGCSNTVYYVYRLQD